MEQTVGFPSQILQDAVNAYVRNAGESDQAEPEVAVEISIGRTKDGDYFYRSTKTGEIIRGFESFENVGSFLRNDLDDPDNFVQTDSDYDEGFEQGIEDASEDCVNLVEYPSESDSWKAGYSDAVEMHDAGPGDLEDDLQIGESSTETVDQRTEYDKGYEQGIDDASEDCVNPAEYPSESSDWIRGYRAGSEEFQAGPTDIVAA